MVSATLLAAALKAQNPRGSLRGTVQDATGARVASAKIVMRAVIVAAARGRQRRPGRVSAGRSAARQLPHHSERRRIRARAVGRIRRCRHGARSHGNAEARGCFGNRQRAGPSFFDHDPVHRSCPAPCIGGVVGSQDLETLPLPARSFANIAYLVPGTEPVEPSDPTKARITAVSTGGSSGLNNELSVDGADNSDDWIGGFLQNFSPDVIQEFAVRTANEDADTGGTTAGRSSSPPSAAPTSGTATEHSTTAPPRSTRASPSKIRRRLAPTEPASTIPSSRSRARTMWPPSAGRLRKIRCGSSPRSRTSMKTPASPTAPPARRNSTRWRSWLPTA